MSRETATAFGKIPGESEGREEQSATVLPRLVSLP